MTIPRGWHAFPVPSAYFPRCLRFLRVFRILALSLSAPRRVRVGPRPQCNATQCICNALRTRTARVADYLPTSTRGLLLVHQELQAPITSLEVIRIGCCKIRWRPGRAKNNIIGKFLPNERYWSNYFTIYKAPYEIYNKLFWAHDHIYAPPISYLVITMAN